VKKLRVAPYLVGKILTQESDNFVHKNQNKSSIS